jgi:hypothetical protein
MSQDEGWFLNATVEHQKSESGESAASLMFNSNSNDGLAN